MTKMEKESELIIAPQPPDLSIFGHDKNVFASNVKASGKELWKLSAKMQGSGIESLSEHIGESIPLAYWYVHRVNVNSMRDGTKVQAVRTVLGTPDGKLYDTVADGIAQSLANLVQIMGNGALPADLVVTVKQIKTRSGFTTLVLEPAD